MTQKMLSIPVACTCVICYYQTYIASGFEIAGEHFSCRLLPKNVNVFSEMYFVIISEIFLIFFLFLL